MEALHVVDQVPVQALELLQLSSTVQLQVVLELHSGQVKTQKGGSKQQACAWQWHEVS